MYVWVYPYRAYHLLYQSFSNVRKYLHLQKHIRSNFLRRRRGDHFLSGSYPEKGIFTRKSYPESISKFVCTRYRSRQPTTTHCTLAPVVPPLSLSPHSLVTFDFTRMLFSYLLRNLSHICNEFAIIRDNFGPCDLCRGNGALLGELCPTECRRPARISYSWIKSYGKFIS